MRIGRAVSFSLLTPHSLLLTLFSRHGCFCTRKFTVPVALVYCTRMVHAPVVPAAVSKVPFTASD